MLLTCTNGTLTSLAAHASTQNHQPAPNNAPETPGPYPFACKQELQGLNTRSMEYASRGFTFAHTMCCIQLLLLQSKRKSLVQYLVLPELNHLWCYQMIHTKLASVRLQGCSQDDASSQRAADARKCAPQRLGRLSRTTTQFRKMHAWI